MTSPTKKEKSNTDNQGWTIKGIEIETRLAIHKAAKKEGMTLGKYCNIKLREAAINTLKIGTRISVQSEEIKEEIKLQIDTLKEELPGIVKLMLEEAKPKQISFLKRIFN